VDQPKKDSTTHGAQIRYHQELHSCGVSSTRQQKWKKGTGATLISRHACFSQFWEIHQEHAATFEDRNSLKAKSIKGYQCYRTKEEKEDSYRGYVIHVIN
jgi:hypothetical protein